MSHYIRLDSKNRIIAGFSDAFPETQPQPGDICILDDLQQTQRQFYFMGEFNPSLLDDRGLPRFKYVNGAAEPTTDADLADLIAALQPEQIKAQLAALDDVLPRCVEDLIAARGVDVTTLPQIMQDRIKEKQTLRAQLAALNAAQS